MNGKSDGGSVAWNKRIVGYRDQLYVNGTIKSREQLKWGHAFNGDEAFKIVKWAYDNNAQLIISSHGHPIDPANDIKEFFGKISRASEFMADMNQRLGETFLTPATPWFSCDHEHGASTPTEIFDRNDGVELKIRELLNR